ncbi:MAG: tetratricopeptide repeat protein, partial [Lewinella sp.]
MVLRTLVFACLILACFSGYGQIPERDTAYWEKFDAEMVDRIWDGMEDPTYRKLFDSLKIEMAIRLQNGPVTESLAYRYHWISLRLKRFFLEDVRPYADTAIMLRIQVNAPTADIAQSYYEKGRVLIRLGSDQEALTFFEEGVRIMSQAIMEEDSTSDLVRRQAYFIKESAVAAGRNGNFELARLRISQIAPLLKKDSSSSANQTAFETKITEGNLEEFVGNIDKSIELYRQAMQLPYFANPSVGNLGVTKNNLGLKLLKSGRYDEAEKELTESVNLLENTDNWLNLSSTYINIMDLRVRQNRPQEALDLLDLAESTAKKVDGTNKGIVFGELYLYAAQAAEQLGQTQSMEELLAQSADALLADAQLYGPAQLPHIEGNTIYGQPTLLQFLAAKRDIFLNAYERSDDTNDLLLAHATSHSIDTLMRLNRDQLNLTASLGQFISKEAEQYTTAVDVSLALYRTTGEATYLNEAYQFVAGQKSNLLRRYLTSPGLAGTLGVPEEVVTEKKNLDLQVLIVERALQNATGTEETELRDSLLRLNYRASRLKETLASEYPAFSKALRGYTAIDPAAAA